MNYSKPYIYDVRSDTYDNNAMKLIFLRTLSKILREGEETLFLDESRLNAKHQI